VDSGGVDETVLRGSGEVKPNPYKKKKASCERGGIGVIPSGGVLCRVGPGQGSRNHGCVLSSE